MSHTPEPWMMVPDEFGAIGRVIASHQQTSGGKPEVVAFDVLEANTRRIIACVNACAGMADPAARIAELIQIEADAKAANLIGPDGKVRRVLGTLPVTRDGLIVGQGATVWDVAAKYAYYDITLASPHNRSYCVPNIPFCSSTPEAAEAAREEKA